MPKKSFFTRFRPRPNIERKDRKDQNSKFLGSFAIHVETCHHNDETSIEVVASDIAALQISNDNVVIQNQPSMSSEPETETGMMDEQASLTCTEPVKPKSHLPEAELFFLPGPFLANNRDDSSSPKIEVRNDQPAINIEDANHVHIASILKPDINLPIDTTYHNVEQRVFSKIQVEEGSRQQSLTDLFIPEEKKAGNGGSPMTDDLLTALSPTITEDKKVVIPSFREELGTSFRFFDSLIDLRQSNEETCSVYTDVSLTQSLQDMAVSADNQNSVASSNTGHRKDDGSDDDCYTECTVDDIEAELAVELIDEILNQRTDVNNVDNDSYTECTAEEEFSIYDVETQFPPIDNVLSSLTPDSFQTKDSAGMHDSGSYCSSEYTVTGTDVEDSADMPAVDDDNGSYCSSEYTVASTEVEDSSEIPAIDHDNGSYCSSEYTDTSINVKESADIPAIDDSNGSCCCSEYTDVSINVEEDAAEVPAIDDGNGSYCSLEYTLTSTGVEGAPEIPTIDDDHGKYCPSEYTDASTDVQLAQAEALLSKIYLLTSQNNEQMKNTNDSFQDRKIVMKENNSDSKSKHSPTLQTKQSRESDVGTLVESEPSEVLRSQIDPMTNNNNNESNKNKHAFVQGEGDTTMNEEKEDNPKGCTDESVSRLTTVSSNCSLFSSTSQSRKIDDASKRNDIATMCTLSETATMGTLSETMETSSEGEGHTTMNDEKEDNPKGCTDESVSRLTTVSSNCSLFSATSQSRKTDKVSKRNDIATMCTLSETATMGTLSETTGTSSETRAENSKYAEKMPSSPCSFTIALTQSTVKSNLSETVTAGMTSDDEGSTDHSNEAPFASIMSSSATAPQRLRELLSRDIWSQDVTIVENALEDLTKEASKGRENRSCIVCFGGLLAIVRAMHGNLTHSGVQIAACCTLAKMADDPEIQTAIGIIGGVKSIAGAMKEHAENEKVQEAACLAFANLTTFHGAATAPRPLDKHLALSMEHDGVVKLLTMSMKRYPGNQKVQENAIRSLTNLCADNKERLAELSQAGGLAAMTMALQLQRENATEKNEAISTRSMLLRGPEECDQ